ncbi:MAG: hypothetical protein JWO03_680 [Bacteroidetes bacterium]|nr:hypothetical protein [Bacteroidota bacterium]
MKLIIRLYVKPRFYTFGFDDEKDVRIVHGEILSIRHKILGDIYEIDTKWHGYKIVLRTGKFILVDPEEKQGRIESTSTFKEDFDHDDFQFEVEIKII